MTAEIRMTLAAAATPRRWSVSQALANRALKASATFWFVVTVAAQLLFAFTIASYYGRTAARGELWAWNLRMPHGYVAGAHMGNFAAFIHLVSAVIVLFAGAIQFVPWVRENFPRVHRWTGRVYTMTAVTVSAAGLYIMFVRGTVGDASQHAGSVLNAVLIWLCAWMAARYAIARKFAVHRRWALRLFLVVSASFFIRVALFLSFLIFGGPFGFDPHTFTGPFLTFLAFAQYLVPLAIAELYFRAQARPGAMRRLAMAAGLVASTVATGAGVFAVAAVVWVRTIKAAYDDRKSIAHTLSVTVESSGIDAAVRQYRDLKAVEPAVYNFDEKELNTLGYQFLRARKFKEAIRIFELNVEAYPKSSNPEDSLADAYLSAGDKARAAAHYRKAVQLDPKNRGAADALRKLGG